MKKVLFVFLVIVCQVGCNKKKINANMQLTGNIKGLQVGKLYLQKMIDTNLVIVETIAIDGDSHFETNINITEPEIYYLYLDRGVSNSLDNRLEFFAEPGKIDIQTTLENFYYDAKITGTRNNELFATYKAIIKQFNDEKLNLTSLRFEAQKAKNYPKIDSIDHKTDEVIKRYYLYSVNFALNNKEYEIAPYITIANIYDINMKYLDTIKKSLPPKIAKSVYGKKLTALYSERLQSGN